MPGRQKSVLIHGDLLGQNIMQTLEDGMFVIDWEYSRLGDPSYDLAIVTRGVKKPFQVESGLERLIDSYLASGGQEIEKRMFMFMKYYLQLVGISSLSTDHQVVTVQSII